MLAIASVACGLFVFMNWLGGATQTRCGTLCPGGLHSVARALVDYHEQNHVYPSGTHLNTSLAYEDRLSWYAEVLPQLDNEEMQKFLLWDQPWNVGFNNKIASTVLKSLICTNADLPLCRPLPALPASYIGIAGVVRTPRSCRRAIRGLACSGMTV